VHPLIHLAFGSCASIPHGKRGGISQKKKRKKKEKKGGGEKECVRRAGFGHLSLPAVVCRSLCAQFTSKKGRGGGGGNCEEKGKGGGGEAKGEEEDGGIVIPSFAFFSFYCHMRGKGGGRKGSEGERGRETKGLRRLLFHFSAFAGAEEKKKVWEGKGGGKGKKILPAGSPFLGSSVMGGERGKGKRRGGKGGGNQGRDIAATSVTRRAVR